MEILQERAGSFLVHTQDVDEALLVVNSETGETSTYEDGVCTPVAPTFGALGMDACVHSAKPPAFKGDATELGDGRKVGISKNRTVLYDTAISVSTSGAYLEKFRDALVAKKVQWAASTWVECS